MNATCAVSNSISSVPYPTTAISDVPRNVCGIDSHTEIIPNSVFIALEPESNPLVTILSLE